MQNEIRVIGTGAAASASREASANQMDLRRRPRFNEALIQGFLFICGAISILTTVGIVYELSKESLSFFTRQLWENTNKRLVVAIDAEANTVVLSTGGAALEAGDTIQIHDEVMKIVGIEGDTLTVERGRQKTEVTPHPAGIDVFKSNRVSFIEFFTGTSWSPQIGQFGIWPLVAGMFILGIYPTPILKFFNGQAVELLQQIEGLFAVALK